MNPAMGIIITAPNPNRTLSRGANVVFVPVVGTPVVGIEAKKARAKGLVRMSVLFFDH
jgi:hypothetical protein